MYIRTYFEVSITGKRIVIFRNQNFPPDSSKCLQKSRSIQTVHVMNIPPTPTTTSFLVRLCCASSQQASGSPDSRKSAAGGPEVSAVCRVTPGSSDCDPLASPPSQIPPTDSLYNYYKYISCNIDRMGEFTDKEGEWEQWRTRRC